MKIIYTYKTCSDSVIIGRFGGKQLGGQRIYAIAVGDETEVFWKFFDMLESHLHGHDAGADTAVIYKDFRIQ